MNTVRISTLRAASRGTFPNAGPGHETVIRLTVMTQETTNRRMTCVECGAVAAANASSARGWRAYLTDEGDPPVYVAVYCPSCARREFGKAHGGRRSAGEGRARVLGAILAGAAVVAATSCGSVNQRASRQPSTQPSPTVSNVNAQTVTLPKSPPVDLRASGFYLCQGIVRPVNIRRANASAAYRAQMIRYIRGVINRAVVTPREQRLMLAGCLAALRKHGLKVVHRG